MDLLRALTSFCVLHIDRAKMWLYNGVHWNRTGHPGCRSVKSLIQYDTIAVNTIVKNKDGEVNSCDILYVEDLDVYNKQYLKYTSQAAANCQDIDLSKRKLKV